MSTAGLTRSLRLWSGLVLFAYVATHLLNHALGLISLGAMEAGARVFLAIWRGPPMTVLLYGAAAVHLALVLWSFYRRRNLRLTAGEWVQAALGVAIVPLVLTHAIGTRLAHELMAVEDSYSFVLFAIWQIGPAYIVQQVCLLVVAWAHGCMGLHYWLRLRPWYGPALPTLYAVALMLPVLALTAFFQRGMEVARLAADPVWMQSFAARANLPSPIQIEALNDIRSAGYLGYALVLLAVIGARTGRNLLERRAGLARLLYPDDRLVSVAAGPSILEISRGAGIPHASVCGGRGRCSTCRVRIGQGRERLAPPGTDEARVLARINAPANVRLACQVHPPPGEYHVTPLLPATAQAREGFSLASHHHGQERDIAILFVDIRGFTTLAEHRLPYDTVFLLNRYFRAMGMAIEAAGGHVDKFIGDGVMALFGLEDPPEAACRAGLEAARRMALALDELNASLSGDLDEPLRIGIGLHHGLTIVGEMGYGQNRTLTAIGDAVNTASRLEALTKEFGCELLVSADVLHTAGLAIDDAPAHDISVRGRAQPLRAIAVADAALLPTPGRPPPRLAEM